ncbi:hypothetical protein LSH36_255g04050 [Paralvinella palmiformis]|uniref:Uncharacterized protein n=1 Tax=Paralvinella palmiformis TaxID=53620 RepID=A0AAD9N498_9ANNE|nr:hypothetical protein LSH36_255g04050 [Paralvinella palmiformis]
MDGTTIVYSGIDLVNFQDEISDKGNSENPDKNDDNEYDDSNARNPVKEIDDPDDSSLNGPDTVHHRGVINRNILSLQEELDDCDEEFIHTTVLTSSSSSEGSLSDEHETLPIESNTKRRFGSSRRCMFAKTGMNTKDNSRNEIQNNEIQTPELDIESDMEISSPEESSTNDVVNKLNDNPQIEPSDDTKRKTSGSYTGYEVSDDDPDSRPPSTGLIPAEEKLSGRTDQNELCSGNEMISDKDEPDLKEVASYASSPCHRPHQTDDEGITDDMDMTSICHPDTSEDMAPSSGQGTSTENVDDTNLDCKLGNQVNTLSQNDRPNEVKAFKQNITSQQATGREKQTSAQNRGKTSEDPDAESKTQSDIDKVEHTTIPGEGYQESHNITMTDNFSLKQDDMKTDINTIIYTSDQVKSTGNNNNTFGQVLGQTNSDIGDDENYGRQTPVAKEVVDATDNTQIIRDVPLDVANQPTVNNPEHVNYTNVISASPEVVNLTNNDMSRRVTASTTATDVQERDKISPTPQWLEQNSGSADAHIRNEETDLTMINVTGSPNTSPAPNIARLDYFQSEANVPGQEEIFSESQTSVVETELTTSCLRELAETNLLNGTVQGNNAPLSVNNGLGVRTSGQFNDCPETSLSEQGVISTKLCASDEISVPSDLNAVSGYVKDLGGNEESRNPEATSSSQIQSNTNKQGYLLAQGVVSKSLPPSTGNFSGARTVSGNETEDASELRNPGEVTISLGESTASDLVYDRDYSKICDGKVIVCQTAQGRIQLTESTDGCNVTSGQGTIVQNTDFVNREDNEVIRPNVPQYNASTQNEAFRQNATSPQTVTMESHRIVQSPGNIPSQSGIRGLDEVGSLRQSNYTSDSGDVFYTQSENNKMETGAYQQTNMLSQANSLTRTDPTGHHNMLVRQDIDGSYPVIVGQDEVMGRAYPMREVSVTNPIIQRMPAGVVSPSGIDMTGRSNVSHFNNTPAQGTTFLGAGMSGEDESSLGMDVSSNISTTTTNSMLLYRNPSDSQVPLQVGNTGTNDTSSFTLSYPNIGSITHTQVGCNTPGTLIHCPVNHQADEGVVCYGPGTTSIWQTGTGMGQSTLDVPEAGYQYTNSDQRSSMQFNNSNNFKGKTDDGINLGITQRRIPAQMKTGIDNVPSQNVNRTEQDSDTSAQIVRNAHPEIDKPIKVSAPRETSTVNQRHLENVVNVSANPQSEIDKVRQVNISAKIYQESQPTTTMRMMTNDVVLSTQSNVQMTTTDQLGQGIKPTGDNMFIQDPGQTIPSIVRQDRLTSQIAVPREVTYADSVHTRHTGSLEVISPSEAISSRHIVRHSSETGASSRANMYPVTDMSGQNTISARHIVGNGTDISLRGQVIQGYGIPTDSIDTKVPHEMDDGTMVNVSMSSSTPLDQSDTITTNVQIDRNAPRQVYIPSGYGISVNSDDLIRDNLVKRNNESAIYGVIPPRDTASAQTNIRAYGCNVSGYVPFMERNAETHLPETNRPIAPEQVLRSHDHDRVSTSICGSERENSYPGSDKIHDTVNNPSLFSNRDGVVLSKQSNVQMTTTDQLGQVIQPTGDNIFVQDPGQTIPSIVRQDHLTSQIAVPREVTYAASVHTRHTGSLEVISPPEANSSRHIVRHSSEMPASYRDNIYPGDDMAGQRTTSERHIVGDGTDISLRGQVIQGYGIPTDSIDAKVPHEMDDGTMVNVSMSSSTPLDQSDTITTNVQIDRNAPRQVYIPSGYGICVNSDDLIRDNLVKRSNESSIYGGIPPRDTASAQTNIRAYGCNVSGYVPFMERNAETHLPETNRPIAPEQVLRSHDHDRVSTSIERENSYPGSDKIHDTVNNPSLFSNREALVKPPTTSEQNDIFLNIETMAEARPVTENIPQHQVTNNARVPDNRPGQRAFFYPEPTSVVHEYTATQVGMAIDNNPFIHPAGVPSTLSRDHEHSTQLDVQRNDRDVLGGGTSPQLGGYYQTSKSGLEDCQSSRMIVEGRREVPTRQFSGHVTAPNVAILNPAVSKFEPNPRIINQSANVQNTESVSGYNDKVHAQRVEPSQGIPVRSNLGQEANYIIHPEAQRPRSDNVLDERNIHFCLEENSRHLNSGQQYLSSDHRKALSRLNSGNFSSLESDAIFQPYEARDSHGYTADFRYESGTATFQPIRGLPPDCHEINGYVTRTRDSGHPSHLYCTDQSETIVINRPRPIYADSERQFVLEGQGHSPNNVSQKSVPSDQMHDSLDQVGTVEADSGSCTDRCRDNGHSKVPITGSKKPYGIHQDIRNDDVCVSSDLGSKRGDNWKEFVDSALDDGFSASLARDNSAFHRRPSRRSSSSKLKRTRERVSRCVQIYTERLLLWDVVGCGETGPIQKLLYLMLQNLVWKCLGDPAW